MLRFGAQISKISNRRKYPLYGITETGSQNFESRWILTIFEFSGVEVNLILRSVNVYRGALLLVPQWQCISSFVFYIKIHSGKLCLQGIPDK